MKGIDYRVDGIIEIARNLVKIGIYEIRLPIITQEEIDEYSLLFKQHFNTEASVGKRYFYNMEVLEFKGELYEVESYKVGHTFTLMGVNFILDKLEIEHKNINENK